MSSIKSRPRPARRPPHPGRESNPDDHHHRGKQKGSFFRADHYPAAGDLTQHEWMFRQLYQGARLAFVGGVVRAHQVTKLMRLGCDLEWLVTGHDRRLGADRTAIDTVRRGQHDFVFVWTGHISHSLFGRLRVALKQAAVARDERGQKPLRHVVSTSLNTEEMARLFTVGDPGLVALESAWRDRLTRLAS